MKRMFTHCVIDREDTFAYCGTTTGDVLEINLNMAIYKRLGPVNRLFSMGVNTLGLLPNRDIIVGAGDG